MRITVLIAAIALLAACSSNDLPKDILPPEKMRLLVYDMVRADELINNRIIRDTTFDVNEQHKKLYDQVFRIHKVGRAEFFKSFRYYQAHPDVNKALFDSLVSYATKKQSAAYNARDTVAK